MEDIQENKKNENDEIIELEGKIYRLLYYVDQGSYGEVHVVEDIKDNKKYALKILREKKCSQPDIDKFENEIKILKELSLLKNNYFTPKIYASGQINLNKFQIQRPSFVLDLAEKNDLSLYVENQNGIKERYAKYIFKRIVEGIQFCHENNIVHFDIKIGNILLDKDYNPLITDFGLSIQYKNLNRNIKDRKGKRGTPYAMCPQMFEKDVYYSGIEADIFSLGVLLFEVVLNRRGFQLAINADKYIYLKTECYDTFWDNYSSKFFNSSKEFKKLYEKMVAYEPSCRPDIDKILSDPWLKEINDLKDQKLEDFKKEYKNYMKQIFIKINDSNETIETTEQIKNGQQSSTKAGSSIEDTKFIDSQLKPIKLSKKEITFKYFVKIKGLFNPVEFMNSLGNIIIQKYGVNKCSIEGDEEIIKLYLIFTEETEIKMNITLFEYGDNHEYYAQFNREECDIKEFYKYFTEIKEIIKTIIL